MTMGKQNENISVNVDKGRIESCNSLRLYGVDIDRQLRFTEHISTVCKKSSQQVGVIVRLRNLIPNGAKFQQSFPISHIAIQFGTFAVQVIQES